MKKKCSSNLEGVMLISEANMKKRTQKEKKEKQKTYYVMQR